MKVIHKVDRKPSKVREFMATLPAPPAVNREDTQAANRGFLAVRTDQDALDDIDSGFFATEKSAAVTLVSDDMAALDALLSKHGMRNLLLALSTLLESRVEDGTFRGDVLIKHLSRADKFSRLAESVETLAFGQDTRLCDEALI